MRITGAAHEPPPAWEVAARISDWADWLAAQEATGAEPVELAAVAHHRLVSIHPFLDGDGRTARLVMNLTLLRAGYPPAIIARANRAQYYRALAAADRGAGRTAGEPGQPGRRAHPDALPASDDAANRAAPVRRRVVAPARSGRGRAL